MALGCPRCSRRHTCSAYPEKCRFQMRRREERLPCSPDPGGSHRAMLWGPDAASPGLGAGMVPWDAVVERGWGGKWPHGCTWAALDPGGTNSGGTNPNGTDPGGTDAGRADTGGADLGGTNPNRTNPGGTNPNGTDPGGTDPGGTNPGGIEPQWDQPWQHQDFTVPLPSPSPAVMVNPPAPMSRVMQPGGAQHPPSSPNHSLRLNPGKASCSPGLTLPWSPCLWVFRVALVGVTKTWVMHSWKDHAH